jgi:hypothetical protein
VCIGESWHAYYACYTGKPTLIFVNNKAQGENEIAINMRKQIQFKAFTNATIYEYPQNELQQEKAKLVIAEFING